jgi:RNA polymerase sigma factor (sigma-70 family)
VVVRSDAVVTFEAFYEANRDRVFRTVSLALPREADPAEATAEAFVRAYARWRSVGAHANPVGWVVKTALNYQRSRWRRPRMVFRSSSVTPAPSEPLEPAIVRELRLLPERQRQVLVLRFLCDLSTEQTGEILGIAPGTVTAHVHRAIGTLRSTLADLEEGSNRGAR